MDKIYSEKELTNSGLPWGDWKFSIPEDKLMERITSLCPQGNANDPHEKALAQLFSIVNGSLNINQSVVEENTVMMSVEDVALENTNVEFDNEVLGESHDSVNVQDLSGSLVDYCNRLVPKLRLDISTVQVESESFISALIELNQATVILVMESAWSQLQSDESKLCFCVIFSLTPALCCNLCKYILLPWLKNHQVSKLELLSKILSREGNVVCVNLIAPLLQTEDSHWVRELPDVEELMSAMTSQHWTFLLKELLSGCNELQEWQIPVLALVVEKSEPSYQELNLLVQIMNSESCTFEQNRDFAALASAVASSLKPDCLMLVPQLKAIVNNFKGSLKVMKLKILKIIADIPD